MTTFVAQVGGDHYKADYQHWDYADETGLPYLESAASKYVSRWRKKGGAADLRKAVSYLAKRMVGKTFYPARFRPLYSPDRLARFMRAAGLIDLPEARVLILIDSWRTRADLQEAIDLIDGMINDAEG